MKSAKKLDVPNKESEVNEATSTPAIHTEDKRLKLLRAIRAKSMAGTIRGLIRKELKKNGSSSDEEAA